VKKVLTSGGFVRLSAVDKGDFVADVFNDFHFVGDHQDGQPQFFVDVFQ